MDDEQAQVQATIWLSLTDEELIRNSASLGLPADLHPDPTEPSGKIATKEQIAELRQNADDVAKEHAGTEFVNNWIRANR